MFYPIDNGSVYEVADNAFGYAYQCQLPPVGYGKDVHTGKIVPVDVIKRSDIPEEQYWERPELDADWKRRRARERNIQKVNPAFVDPYCEQIRRREWKRRRCGLWFWNYNPFKKESELRYMVGMHYLYCTYWKFQGKFADFRIPDSDYWYVRAYCDEDPHCLGMNEITKRKNGKTARAGLWLYERTSRMRNHHGGIQSKADDDAEEVYKKAVMHPWQKLPDFFKPNYDTNKGDAPADELRFFAPSRRGKAALEEAMDEALDENEGSAAKYLDSFIDFKSSAEAAYDGPELHSYISDESGKTKKPVSIKERQNVVRYCTEIDFVMKGKHHFTTTVEIEENKKTGELEEDNYEFQEMTAKSNPLERDDNNHTGTGLYTFFLPAQKGMMFDNKYGYPNEEKAIVSLLNRRKKYIEDGDTRGLSSFKRKNPMTFKEAFSQDGTHSLYDPELLNEQLEDIAWRNDLTEFGDLVWHKDQPIWLEVDVNGDLQRKLNKVEWKQNTKGKFEKVIGWWPKEPNKVFENNGIIQPNNNFAFRVGYDTFKYDKTKSKRRSNAAAFAYQIKDELFPSQYEDMFVLRYSARPSTRRIANMDVLMMAWLCGCQILVERNAGDHYKEHYSEPEVRCGGFLMWLPGEKEPGITTDGAGKTTQTICNYTEQYINEHIKKVYFKSLLRKDSGWLGFKVEDTEKFDEPMAAGITLIAVKGKKYMKPATENTNIENLLPYHKATA
jgi:hypothetical protein